MCHYDRIGMLAGGHRQVFVCVKKPLPFLAIVPLSRLVNG